LSFLDLELKTDYDSEQDDILNNFYIPLLAKSRKYYRLAGFFSSSALTIAARGIAPFIQNGGTMHLVVGAVLQKEDIEAIRSGKENPEKILSEIMVNNLDEIHEELTRDHVRALAWLVARNQLEIKIAIVVDEEGYPVDENCAIKRGIFHQKVGIVEDFDGNKVSFSGSVNESAAGWEDNIEEFKVFRSWMDGEGNHFNADSRKFEKYWFGRTNRVEILDFPKAVREHLISMAPSEIKELRLERFYRRPNLRDYQIKAISAWQNNGSEGILEMATGTGKTYTAIGCLLELLKREKALFVVISCPFTHLIQQWKDNLTKFSFSSFETFGANPEWEDMLANVVLDFNSRILNVPIIITTHDTFSSEKFIRTVEKVRGKTLIIGDEVHGLGSPERHNGLLERYDFRLGLSATPTRWFDEEGTAILSNYFGKVVFEFPIKRAIEEGFLCKYDYHPYLVKLTGNEMDEYQRLTKKIAKQFSTSKNQKEKDEFLKLYAILRQRIIANASMKYSVLEEILDSLEEISHCLIYCSPQQIDVVQELLNKRGIVQHKFTANENVKERRMLLDSFAKGNYKALVAMKCLDEGVDVPATKTAIIMASSTNPKEFIQRRGRILRTYSGKEKATIYDFIVVPELTGQIDPVLINIEARILAKELRRYTEFARSAINRGEAYMVIQEVASKYHIILEE
jgi:superfamily II DNA or RNA helicase